MVSKEGCPAFMHCFRAWLANSLLVHNSNEYPRSLGFWHARFISHVRASGVIVHGFPGRGKSSRAAKGPN